ncbi:hypothetical protein KAZ57_01755, partial [Patescibacteria group bacterium]|nr:hypothetical protein [Patescibacteria group bacterium]
RKSNFKKELLKFNISLPDFATLHEVTFPYNDSDKKNYICVSYDKTYSTEISDSLVDIIKRCALSDSIEKVLNRLGVKKSDKFLFEIFELWSKRIIKLTPTK